MNTFNMNGILWTIKIVDNSFNDNNYLVDRTGTLTIATTDPETHSVYIDNRLTYDQLIPVLIHELSHCCMISYGLINDVHRIINQEKYIEMEEWICNFVMKHGYEILQSVSNIINSLYLHPL